MKTKLKWSGMMKFQLALFGATLLIALILPNPVTIVSPVLCLINLLAATVRAQVAALPKPSVD